MIPREIIDEIVYRNDISDVVRSYINLKRAGSNLHGLCPFHSEKTPSFTVFSGSKSFYCFGCGAGGDVITFIMRLENLTYPEALELLAKRSGIPIPETQDTSRDENYVPKQRVLDMNLEAAKFFRKNLFDENTGKAAMEYLTQSRKLDLAAIRRFGIGFAPGSFSALTNYLTALGFTAKEIRHGFLGGISEKTGGVYDYFRNRIIFPIIDTSQNVIAFGGRVMDDSMPKYLNTSDTAAFKKSRNLFALNIAKNYADEQMLLCEGYMDVIALHAAGFQNAVATLGTAITPDQSRIFAKYTKKVIICYDSDNAGQNAANKAMRLLSEVGIEVKVLNMEGAKDPDEFIKKFGTGKFKLILDGSKSGFEHKLDKILAAHNIEIQEEKIKASAEICGEIADFSSEVERDIYIYSAAKKAGFGFDALKNDVERLRKRRTYELRKKESKDAQLSIKNIGDRINPDAAKSIRANSAEETLIGLMLLYEDHRSLIAKGAIEISPDDFSTEFGRRVFEAILELERMENGFSKAVLGQYFSIDEMGRIEKMEQTRRMLSNNGIEVLRESVENIKLEKAKNCAGTDAISDIKNLINIKKSRST